MRPFHLAFPVNSIEETRRFYTQILGCKVGREDQRWIDLNFFGHQISAHLCDDLEESAHKNEVDNKGVPTRHFGVVLDWKDWCQLSERLCGLGVEFYIEPYIRFAGEIGEQGTFFIQDPSSNFLEFKSFKDEQKLFER